MFGRRRIPSSEIKAPSNYIPFEEPILFTIIEESNVPSSNVTLEFSVFNLILNTPLLSSIIVNRIGSSKGI